jgi:hypothetical protein
MVKESWRHLGTSSSSHFLFRDLTAVCIEARGSRWGVVLIGHLRLLWRRHALGWTSEKGVVNKVDSSLRSFNVTVVLDEIE